VPREEFAIRGDDMTPDFSASAQKLARNPLGIIALFLLLVYGIAGLVFSVAAKGLIASERQPLVWFLVVFPVLVLGMFGWLVARHHTKLYAPSDYRDSEGFFRALTVGEQRAKLEAEFESLQSDTTDVERRRSTEPTSDGSQTRSEVQPRRQGTTVAVTPSTAQSDDSRVRTVDLVKRRRLELRSAVVLAEELACRKLEVEFRLPVLRHVGLPNGARVDALIQTPQRPTAVEIIYTRTFTNVRRVADEVIAQAVRIGPSFQMLVVLVMDAPEPGGQQRLERVLQGQLGQQRIDYRVYDFKALHEEFGIVPD
jgi:hypothetical protein